MQIIYQNPDFLIINKPSGLLTHPANSETALTDELLKILPKLKDVGPDPTRPGIVHRLDKETSGLLVVAKTNEMYKHLRRQFDEGKIKKEYIALVYGEVKKEQGEINLPIGRSAKGLFVAAQPTKKFRSAKTEYLVLQRFKDFTSLILKPTTGRTHQLRVHLKTIGHPIVGDPLYRVKLKQRIDFPRLFLHASKLGFYDLQGKWREFELALPGELKEFAEGLTLSLSGSDTCPASTTKVVTGSDPIVISGPPSSGSSTIARQIAEKLNLKYFSVGELQKELIKGWQKKEAKAALEAWQTPEGSSFKTHKDRDDFIIKIAKRGAVVICGKLSIHFLKNLSKYKIWLEVPLKIRAKRAILRDKISFEQALEQISKREKIEREEWGKMYGFDYFDQKYEADFVLDSSDLTVKQTVQKILDFIQSHPRPRQD